MGLGISGVVFTLLEGGQWWACASYTPTPADRHSVTTSAQPSVAGGTPVCRGSWELRKGGRILVSQFSSAQDSHR